MHREETSEVQIAAIHPIEAASLHRQEIQHVDLVQLAIADVNEGRNRAAKVQQRVQLDLYELAKILGHSNIKMTERYAKLGRQHIARTGNTAREMWKLLALEEGDKAYAV